jgi:hypothetical protein
MMKLTKLFEFTMNSQRTECTLYLCYYADLGKAIFLSDAKEGLALKLGRKNFPSSLP